MKKITYLRKNHITFIFLLFSLFISSLGISQVLVVSGNNNVISNNDTTPSLTDFTDFGSIPSGNKFSRSFVLKNTASSGNLVFPANAVSISNTTDFSITTNVILANTPYTKYQASNLLPNNYTIIQISFNPTSSAEKTATVTINLTTGSPKPYKFDIKGIGTASVSSDYAQSQVVLNNTFSYPYALIYGPDNYLWLTERGGKKINRVNKLTGVVDQLIDMTSLVYYGAIGAQDGLLGMALHPNLGKATGEDYVYVAYTYGTSSANERLRIVRYTYSITGNDGSLSSPLTLIEGLSAGNDHQSGKLAIGPDMKLYYTIGDQGVNQFGNKCNVSHAQLIPSQAQLDAKDYSNYQGKILRLNLDGTIPSDNPTINSVKSHIFTYGHRNAQGLLFNKNGVLYSTEHGPKSDDEINILKSGGNYGWPFIAGYKDDKNYVFCDWSTATNCSGIAFSDYDFPPGASTYKESDWNVPFTPPITTLFTIADGFNFTGGWLTWPTVGPSSAKIYEGFNSEIPGWDNSIFMTTLKKGRIYRQKLSADGTGVVGAPEELFYTQNRYRDVAFDPDGKTVYIITDSGGSTSGPSGSSSLPITNPGTILKFTYTPALVACVAPVPTVTTLADVTGSCSVTLTPPTATNACSGTIVGTTTSVFPITSPGTTVVTWTYNYGNGNSVTQNQNVIISSTTWNGFTWSNGSPISGKGAIITGNLTISTNLTACSLTVNNNAVVTVNSGVNITLDGALTVSSGSFTLNNNANLMQTSTVGNSGNITIKRDSSPLKRLDYTLWSSPVNSQNLFNFSPLTTAARFYNYSSVSNAYSAIASPSTTNFTDGQGYLIRMPNTHPATPTVWNGSFFGVPHNGSYPFTMTNGGVNKRFNLVGNPYPSPISMTQFVADNSTTITGTLYFWRKTNGGGTAYCSWAGGTFVSNMNAQTINPLGIIQTGQGFFVEALNASTSLQFNNGQRVTNNTGQFFKIKQITTDRSTIWLNASNILGDFSQMAIGYIADATEGVDIFDGKYYNDSEFALNTIIDNEDYVIQGRPLPFDPSTEVSLSFKTITAGNYTIAVDHVDGLFSGNQDIILKDSATGTETDLKAGSYSFTAEAGVTNTRFSLKYQKTLGINSPVFDENSLVVFKNNDKINIKSNGIAIDNIKVYDIRGRLLLEKTKVNANETSFESAHFANQVLIVQITSSDNKVVKKKVVN